MPQKQKLMTFLFYIEKLHSFLIFVTYFLIVHHIKLNVTILKLIHHQYPSKPQCTLFISLASYFFSNVVFALMHSPFSRKKLRIVLENNMKIFSNALER